MKFLRNASDIILRVLGWPNQWGFSPHRRHEWRHFCLFYVLGLWIQFLLKKWNRKERRGEGKEGEGRGGEARGGEGRGGEARGGEARVKKEAGREEEGKVEWRGETRNLKTTNLHQFPNLLTPFLSLCVTFFQLHSGKFMSQIMSQINKCWLYFLLQLLNVDELFNQ